MENLILLTDSYKITHWPQYPENTEEIYSYFESRGGMFDQTVFFGLQYIIKKFLLGQVITKEKIEEAKTLIKGHLGNDNLFNEEGWNYILKEYDGRLPVSIKAVPEGSVVANHNILMSIRNLDKKCYWLTNYLETLLVQCWYGTTVATLSREIKKVIKSYLNKTGDPLSIDFKLHDFGFRGVSSVESAAIGGAAHLINFKGTDTLIAIKFIQDYYQKNFIAGFSIPASEHSTITSWGRENEILAMKNMLEKYPTGLVACVSDSYDIYNACSNIWGQQLKELIINRDGVLIIRPDSGEPKKVIVQLLAILDNAFGSSINPKGYKLLNPKVRLIQGDGVNYDSIKEILKYITSWGYSTDNIAFGMGGALLQKLDRDTQKFAFKCSNALINGENRDVYKEPITDKGKNSKKGKLKLLALDGSHGKFYTTVREEVAGKDDVLKEVFRYGDLLIDYDFETIRKNSETDFFYWS